MKKPQPFRRSRSEHAARTSSTGRTLRRVAAAGLLVLAPLATMTPAQAASDVVPGGTTLNPGEARSSQNGNVVLRMQTDGNLVLYTGSGAAWDTGTQGAGNRSVMQTDGNLVVYSGGGQALWDSHTGYAGSSFLKIQDDGKLVIYGPSAPTWQSADGCGGVSGPVGPGSTATARNGIVVHACLVDSVRMMQDSAAADGVSLAGGGYRDMAAQIALRRSHCGPSEYDIWRKPAKQCSPPTAPPGRSMHERGLAIDFSANGSTIGRGSAQFAWLSSQGYKFGLHNLPSESWHWSTDGT